MDRHGRALATIRYVASKRKLENSDNLEIITLKNLGWEIVTKKDEFEIGDGVVYFEIDSCIRISDLLPCMEFLKSRCLRKFVNKNGTLQETVVKIKTLKLRGVISQGLIIPLKTILEEMPIEWTNGCCLTFDDGEDWSDYLRVEHFDVLSELYTPVSIDTKGPFPSFVPKTDEVRLQSLMDYFDIYSDTEFEITEKFDGSSYTVVYASTFRPNDPIYICSRNQEKKPDKTAHWFKPFANLTVDTFRSCFGNRNIAIQGELVGPGINANRDKYTDFEWRVFRIFDIDRQKFVTPEIRYQVCKDLGLQHVKVIDTCKVFQKFKNISSFIDYVSTGKTDHGNLREGMVFKSTENGNISFKVINPEYLIKNDE